jgi:manganese/iron transport system ATP-binding protein
VGINGSGKSTLFKALMGFVRLSHGEIAILGQPVHRALRQNLVAYVPQSEEVDWSFPVLVEDVVMMGRYGHMGWLRRAKAARPEVVDAALARVGMSEYRHRQIGELSGGQKKRVFLARAIAQQGKVILLDEPFTGVDVQTEARIISLLRELRDEGCTMLVSTHNLGSVSEFCDYTVMVKGTVLASGPTETTFTAENLELAFSGVLRHVVLSGGKSRLSPTMSGRLSAAGRREAKDELAAGAVWLSLYAECDVGIGAGGRRVRLSLLLPDAERLVADWRRPLPLHRTGRGGSLYARPALRRRRVSLRRPGGGQHAVSQPAFEAQRGCHYRPDLFLVLRYRAVYGVAEPDFGEYPDHYSRQYSGDRPGGYYPAGGDRLDFDGDSAAEVERPDGDLFR